MKMLRTKVEQMMRDGVPKDVRVAFVEHEMRKMYKKHTGREFKIPDNMKN